VINGPRSGQGTDSVFEHAAFDDGAAGVHGEEFSIRRNARDQSRKSSKSGRRRRGQQWGRRRPKKDEIRRKRRP